ncbi:alpha/beta hydrolase [Mangrovicoccus ximenensis]|uniref:alpha/beta hydrolase n=1 Tax=Mangrovicoccus ximenensis TaxID=1911570 RepID=UPI000D39AADE|nr:alpha/beta hydrolase [Mangrovicoccus ximenensis]
MTTLYAGYPDQETLDRAYDVEGAVPDFMAYASRYMADSAAARNLLKPRLDVPYGPTRMETLEVYAAQASDPAPILVFIHGGAWKSLDASVFSLVAPGPVAAGMAVVNVTYDLCPHVSIEEMVRQVRAAISWTWRNADGFGGDRDRIIVAGHSAGAHLTTMATLTDWDRYGLPEDVVKGAFGISGIYDMEPISRSFLQPYLRLTADAVRWQSPIRNLRTLQTPLTLAWGTDEPEGLISSSQAFEKAWQAVGNSVSSFTLEDANHFDVLDGFADKDGVMTRAVQDLLERSAA